MKEREREREDVRRCTGKSKQRQTDKGRHEDGGSRVEVKTFIYNCFLNSPFNSQMAWSPNYPDLLSTTEPVVAHTLD